MRDRARGRSLPSSPTSSYMSAAEGMQNNNSPWSKARPLIAGAFGQESQTFSQSFSADSSTRYTQGEKDTAYGTTYTSMTNRTGMTGVTGFSAGSSFSLSPDTTQYTAAMTQYTSATAVSAHDDDYDKEDEEGDTQYTEARSEVECRRSSPRGRSDSTARRRESPSPSPSPRRKGQLNPAPSYGVSREAPKDNDDELVDRTTSNYETQQNDQSSRGLFNGSAPDSPKAPSVIDDGRDRYIPEIDLVSSSSPPPPSSLPSRHGYKNQCVVMRSVDEDAAEALDIVSEYMPRKSKEELKPFAVVEVEASTVSMMDTLIRRDRFLHSPKVPYKMGCDMIGRVVQVGKGSMTHGISEGDRVCAIDFNFGGHSRYVTVPCYDLIKVPSKLDSARAVCLLRPYVTAYQCLHNAGERPIMEGDRVLVVGGTGAIGQAVVELAIEAGARSVYATGEGRAAERLLRSKGAMVLGREPEEWLPAIEGRVDIVIDLVCSDGYASSHKALRTDGTGKLVCVGATAKQNPNSFLMGNFAASASMTKAAYFMQNTTIYDFFASLESDPKGYRQDLEELFLMLKEMRVSPRISKFVLLDEMAEAHEDIEIGGLNGHVICRPNPTKKFMYNGDGSSKKQQQSLQSKSITWMKRDDVSFSSDEEDESQCSQSISLTTLSSSYTGSYSTYEDDVSTAYSESTTGTPTFSTLGFLPGNFKNVARGRRQEGPQVGKGAIHSALVGTSVDNATLSAIGEEIEPINSNPSLKAKGTTPNEDKCGEKDESTKANEAEETQRSAEVDELKVEKESQDEHQVRTHTSIQEEKPTKSESQKSIQEESSKTKEKHGRWLKRIPSLSSRSKGTVSPLVTTEEEPQSPISSEQFVRQSSSKGGRLLGGLLRSKKSKDKGATEEEMYNQIDVSDDKKKEQSAHSTSVEDPDFLSYMMSFFSAEKVAKGENDKSNDNEEAPNAQTAKDPEVLSFMTSFFSTEEPTSAQVQNEGKSLEDVDGKPLDSTKDKKDKDTTAALNNVFSHFSTKEEAGSTVHEGNDEASTVAGSVSSALRDLFWLTECISPKDSNANGAKDTPLKITIPEGGDNPASPTLGADFARFPLDSFASDDSSTFIATGFTMPQNSPGHGNILQKQIPRQSSPISQEGVEIDQVSALAGTVLVPLARTASARSRLGNTLQKQSPKQSSPVSHANDSSLTVPSTTTTPVPLARTTSARSRLGDFPGKKSTKQSSQSPQNTVEMDQVSALTGMASEAQKTVPLDFAAKNQSTEPSRVKGLSKTTTVPFERVSSAHSPRGPRRQASHVSLARSSSAVSIKCDASDRQFHVPTSVASSVMSVSTSGSGSGKSARNIYTTRTTNKAVAVQRLPRGGKGKKGGLFRKR